MNAYLTGWVVSSNDAFKRLIFSIFMACILACAYVVQNYVTSDILFLGTKEILPNRHFNLFDIGVFVVLPIGAASFITMLLALWALWVPDHSLIVLSVFSTVKPPKA
ncbi:unnamed protein product [Pneumocystis jirovecii]|uniref:Uncharacterized protein n=1 Tax=Pneumocystis jirovecii TaxID=42068 RepID=L0PEG3_PNEJI|nr:unnamed protein product [Pneumocystis jirovecii]